MVAPSPLLLARNALFSVAREHSPVDEAQCRALLELFETCNLLDAALRRELAPPDLTEIGFRLLAYLLDHGSAPVTLGEAGRQLGLNRRTVSILLGRFEVAGLVSIRQTAGNSRAFVIRATPAGRRAFTSTLSHYIAVITRVMSALDPTDVTALDQACAHLRRALLPAPPAPSRPLRPPRAPPLPAP